MSQLIHPPKVVHRNIPVYASGAMDMDPLTKEQITIPNKHDSSMPHLTLEEPHSMMEYVLPSVLVT
jgi:hypothetical protein